MGSSAPALPALARVEATRKRGSRFLRAAGLGLLVLAAASLGWWTQRIGGIGGFWLPSAILLGVLVRNPHLATPAGCIAVAAGYFIPDYLMMDSPALALMQTLGDMTSAGTAYALYTRVPQRERVLSQPIGVLHFVRIAAIAAAVSAVVGLPVASDTSRGAWNDWEIWFAGDFVTYIAFTPPILAFPKRNWLIGLGKWTRKLSFRIFGPIAALMALAGLGTAVGGAGAIALPLPALLWCAVFYDLFTAVVLTSLFGVWVLLVLAFGYVPIPLDREDGAAMLSLRLGISFIMLAPIAIASVMAAHEELRKRLEEKNKALAVADQAKNRFLALMSYELRTPMTGVLGMADLLLESSLNAEQEKFTRTLWRSANSLLTLLNDILDLSKIEAGQLQIDRAPFLLSDAVSDVRALFSGIAADKGLQIRVEMPEQVQDGVLGDDMRFRQVLSNLVGNAVKFTERGHVAITLTQRVFADGTVTVNVVVSDTGIGIAQDKISALFRPFSQADASITRKFGGTGLGLAVCRNLVRAMGGEITVESVEGEGTSFGFLVRLGVAEGEEAVLASTRAKAQALPVVEAAARSLDVMIAEDNDIIRTLVADMLRRAGHSVTAVEDGAAAVTMVKQRRFDVVLMDMQMPVLDGPDAIRAIRAWEAESPLARTPIIALTADVRGEGRQIYREAGADAVHGKPIAWAPLLHEMRVLADDGAAAMAPDTSTELPYARNEAVFNDAALEPLRTQLGAQKVEELLQIFIGSLDEYQVSLAEALATKDLSLVRRVAHGLRGVSVQFGAHKLARIAGLIELEITTMDGVANIAPQIFAAIAEVQNFTEAKAGGARGS